QDERVIGAFIAASVDFSFGRLDHGRVVATGQTTVRRDDHVGDLVDFGGLCQEWMIGDVTAFGEVLDDTGQVLAVRACGGGALLGFGDTGGGDEFHRSGDLLGRLNTADSSPQLTFLTTGHRS